MPTIDSLAVRLEADVQVFQQQLDRARAELSKFAAGAAPVVGATDKIGKSSAQTGGRLALLASQFTMAGQSANKSTGGLGRLNDAFITITRQATGLPVVIAKLTDVFGTFLIGVGPMIPILAGAAGLAWAISKVTEESRKAKKEVEELAGSLDKLRESQRDPKTLLLAQALRADEQLLQARLKLSETLTPRTVTTDTGESVTMMGSASDIQKAFQNVELWQHRQGAAYQALHEAGTKHLDGIAEANKRTAAQVAADWRAAYAEIERAARQFVQFHPELKDIALPFDTSRPTGAFGMQRRPETGTEAAERLGFFVPRVDAASNALDGLKNTTEKLNRQIGMLPHGAPPVAGGPGFFGKLEGSVSSMLNPEMIASGLATGFISTGINVAISGLTKLGASLLGFGEHVRSAANVVNDAVRRINDQIIALTGSDIEQALSRARQAVAGVLSELFGGDFGIHLADFQSFDALLAELQRLYEFALKFGTVAQQEAYAAAIDLATAHLQSFADALRDAARNIPRGYKIDLAEYNATMTGRNASGIPWRPGAATTPTLRVIVQANPRGFFRDMEQQAVVVKRTGGQLAWEIA